MATFRKIAGVTRLDGSIAQATLRLYDAATGALRAETTSDVGTGEYEFEDSTGEVMAVGETFFVLADYGSGVRPLAHGPIVPVEGEWVLWTPSEITEALWLDAADAETLTLVSGKISIWGDKSGSGNSASQDNDNDRPSLEAGGPNGLNVLFFSDDFLQGSAFPHATASIFAVRKFNFPNGPNTVYGNCIFCDGNAGSFGSSAGIRFDNFSGSSRFGARSGFSLYANSSDGWHIQAGVYDGTTRDLYLDGAMTSTGSATGDTSPLASKFTLGRFQTSTEGLVDTKRADVYLAEIIVVDSAVSEDVRCQIEGYLAHKWGLQANLPGDHPYKDAPPYVT